MSAAVPIWRCEHCGSDDGPHFDRFICACGSMHYYCGECGQQDDPCDSTSDYEDDTTPVGVRPPGSGGGVSGVRRAEPA